MRFYLRPKFILLLTILILPCLAAAAQPDRFVGVWAQAEPETGDSAIQETARQLLEQYQSRYAGWLRRDSVMFLIALPSDSEDYQSLEAELREHFPSLSFRAATRDEFRQIGDELRK